MLSVEFFTATLSAIMVNVIMVNVVMLNVIGLNVTAPRILVGESNTKFKFGSSFKS
jgi:hypothetical protein